MTPPTLIPWLKVRDLLWSIPGEGVFGINRGLDGNTCTATNWPDTMGSCYLNVHTRSIKNPIVFNGR